MGSKCSCCFQKNQQASDTDSLSKRSDMAVNGQAKRPPKHAPKKKKFQKKITKAVSLQLQKQQSRYFNQKRILQSQSNHKQSLLLSPNKKQLAPKRNNEQHSSYYNRVKDKLKPQIPRICNVEQQYSSRGQYYKQHISDDDQQSTSQYNQKQLTLKLQSNKHNISLNYPSPPIILEKQYRTANNKDTTKTTYTPSEIQKLQSLADQESAQPLELFLCYFQLAQYKYQEKDYSSSQKYISKALNIFNNNSSLNHQHYKFKLYILAGEINYSLNNHSNALDFFLKALKFEIIEKGSNSIKLIQVYYWLGQTYLLLGKHTQSKDYFSKAYRLYLKHQIQQHRLMATICLKLGNAYFFLQEYIEADRYYSKGIKYTKHQNEVGIVLQLMLRSAQNQFYMDSYRACFSRYNSIFRLLNKFEWQNEAIYKQAERSFGKTLLDLQKMSLPQTQLKILVNLCQQSCPVITQLAQLKLSLSSPST